MVGVRVGVRLGLGLGPGLGLGIGLGLGLALEVLREQHVGHRRGVPLVVVIGRVAYGRLDTAPPRVGSERAVVAREARPAEAEARLEAGSVSSK